MTRPRGPSRLVTCAIAAVTCTAVAAACERGPAAGYTVEMLPVDVFSGMAETADPTLAVDPGTGDLLMAWVARTGDAWDLYFARSSDGGETFSPPQRVNDVPGDPYPHAEGAPRMVAAPGVIALFWNNHIEAPGRTFAASEVRFARSTDGGATWSPARSLQDPLEFEGLPPRPNTFFGAGLAGDSTLVVAWIDSREADRRRVARGIATGLSELEAARRVEEFVDLDDLHDRDGVIYAAVSHDLGATWEPSNTRIQEWVCNCCRVSLVRDEHGGLIGAWRRHFDGGIRDPVTQTVFDASGAPVVEDPLPIHVDGWVIPGCPHSGPGLAVEPDGTAHAAWYTGAEGRMGVHYARRAPGAERFDSPMPIVTGDWIPVAHPAVVPVAGGAVVAHNVNDEGERVIVLTIVAEDGRLSYRHQIAGSDNGTHPQLALLPGGRVFVAWTQSRDGLQHVRLARLTTPGASADAHAGHVAVAGAQEASP